MIFDASDDNTGWGTRQGLTPAFPGMVARKHNPAMRAFGDRLKQNGMAPKAVIGAVMRKLVHLIYGVIKSGRPFDVTLAMPRLDFQDGN